MYTHRLRLCSQNDRQGIWNGHHLVSGSGWINPIQLQSYKRQNVGKLHGTWLGLVCVKKIKVEVKQKSMNLNSITPHTHTLWWHLFGINVDIWVIWIRNSILERSILHESKTFRGWNVWWFINTDLLAGRMGVSIMSKQMTNKGLIWEFFHMKWKNSRGYLLPPVQKLLLPSSHHTKNKTKEILFNVEGEKTREDVYNKFRAFFLSLRRVK